MKSTNRITPFVSGVNSSDLASKLIETVAVKGVLDRDALLDVMKDESTARMLDGQATRTTGQVHCLTLFGENELLCELWLSHRQVFEDSPACIFINHSGENQRLTKVGIVVDVKSLLNSDDPTDLRGVAIAVPNLPTTLLPGEAFSILWQNGVMVKITASGESDNTLLHAMMLDPDIASNVVGIHNIGEPNDSDDGLDSHP